MKTALKWIGAGLVAAFVVVAVGSFGFDTSGRVDDPEPLADDLTYVALGDSFSAGEGLGKYLEGTRDTSRGDAENRCHRSEHAYAYLLGHDLEGDFHFRACSGAVLKEIFEESQEHGGVDTGGPQLGEGDEGLAPDVVTVTIGGNDAGFAKVVAFCLQKSGCLDAEGFKAPDDGPETTVRAFATRKLPQIQSQLATRVYEPLRRWYPNPDTRIIVLGYPLLLPEVASTTGQRRCEAHKLAFDDGERAEIRRLGAEFNGLLAHQALKSGLEYVDVAHAFAGHETCGPEGAWLDFPGGGPRGIGEAFDGILAGSVPPGAFHPTEDGQSMYGRLVRCYLDAHPNRPYAPDYRPASAVLAEVADGVAIGLTGDAVHACATG